MALSDEEMEKNEERSKPEIYAKRFVAAGFLLLIVAGHFWIYYQIFQQTYPQILDGLSFTGITLLGIGGMLYIYSYFKRMQM